MSIDSTNLTVLKLKLLDLSFLNEELNEMSEIPVEDHWTKFKDGIF